MSSPKKKEKFDEYEYHGFLSFVLQLFLYSLSPMKLIKVFFALVHCGRDKITNIFDIMKNGVES